MFDSGFSANRFHPTLVIIIMLCSTWVNDAGAWRILMAEPIPDGALSMTSQQDMLWCGYEVENDSLISVIDPGNGNILRSITPPEATCLGICSYQGAIWFLGSQHLYQLDANGRIVNQYDSPYESMRGLAGTDDGIWSVVNDDGIRNLVLFVPGGEEVHQFETTLQNVGDITWDSQYIWVTDTYNGFLHLFDPAVEREIEIYPTPVSQPFGMTFINADLYLIDEGYDENTQLLYRIDPSGQSAPRLMPSAVSYDFGVSLVLNDHDWNLVLYNIGNEMLVIDSVKLASGEDYFEIGQLPNRFEIAMNGYAIVNMAFNPIRYQLYQDTLEIYSNDPINGTWRIGLSGIGIMPSRHLGVYPEELNFGVVRADPWRDGSRLRQLALVSIGNENLRIDSLKFHIADIFAFDRFDTPVTLLPADTLLVNFWFCPHRGIEYIDTLLIYSNRAEMRAMEIIMLGQGSDSIYAAGTSMWYLDMEDGGEGVGTASRSYDINRDNFDEVVAVGPDGTVYCLNGFASGEADVIWSQSFAGHAFRPSGILPEGCISGSSDFNSDGIGDIILGSGVEDRSVYCLNGVNGNLLWRWDSRNVGGTGAILRIHTNDDRNGDGSVDPVVLLEGLRDGNSQIVRIDGATGRAVWLRNTPPANLLESLGDINHDGVSEYALGALDGNLYVYSGADGGLMNVFETGVLNTFNQAVDLNEDDRRDLIVAPQDGGLSAWSILDGERLWLVDDLEQGVPIGSVEQMEIIDPSGENDWYKLAAYNTDGLVFKIDLTDMTPGWFDATEREITCLGIHPDLEDDNQVELLVGFENGRIECRSGANGSQLWAFSGDEVNWEQAYKVFAFEDVDLGGSVDLVGLFGDGTVRCISSGGDVGVESPDVRMLPLNAAFDGIYPNPFNGPTELVFSITRKSNVTLSVFDISGRMIGSLIMGNYGAGTHTIGFDPGIYNQLASGVYLFMLNTADEQHIKRGVLLK